jgi:hypothetical protein
MLDNKKITALRFSIQQQLPYDAKVARYDSNCADCEFKKITVTNGKKVIPCNSLDEAIEICLNNRHYSIQRGCQYGGESFTLNEIITNSCKLWNPETIETEGVPFGLVLQQVKISMQTLQAKTIEIKEAVLVRNISDIGEKYNTEIILQQRSSKEISTGFPSGTSKESESEVNSISNAKTK